jgi:hypothetical protein
MTDTSDEAVGRIVHRLTHGTVSNAVDADAAAMLGALLDERNQLRIRHSDYMNDYVQMGTARDAAEAECNRLRKAIKNAADVIENYDRDVITCTVWYSSMETLIDYLRAELRETAHD